MILFASVCTATRQKKVCDIMIQQHRKTVYHSFNTFFSSYNIHSAWTMALLPELSLKSHLVLVFHSFQFLR